LKYYGFDTQDMSDEEFAATFWVLMDIRKKEMASKANAI
jgi:hypothetical protein